MIRLKINNAKKTMATMILIFSIMLAMVPSLALANLSDRNKNKPIDSSVFTLPSNLKTGSMEDLIAITGSYKDASKDLKTDSKPFVEYAKDFKMPEIANMSHDEICRQLRIPGYYTPSEAANTQMISQDSQVGILSTPQYPVQAIVVCDDEMRYFLSMMLNYPIPVPWEWVYSWANNILEDADNPLESDYGIDLVMAYAINWETPDSDDYVALLYTVSQYQGGIDPRTAGCDVMIVMSGQNPGYYNGNAILGLTWGPGGPMDGRHSVLKATAIGAANICQHEVTHFFGPGDCYADWCIMNSVYSLLTRGYCSGCVGNINEHADRYD